MIRSRDDDIDYIIKDAQQKAPNTAMHVVNLLALICKAVRDLQKTNAT